VTATAARTMQSVVVAGPGAAHERRVPVPEPGEGEVLVRVEGCGVCGSSLPLWEGRPWFGYPAEPGAPGHEAWGVEVQSGRRVALLSYRGFAEYEAVPEAATVPLPPELDGSPFPGEALGCALNVFARSGIAAGETVGVVGTGFLGLLLVQLAVRAGARVLAFSRRDTGLAHARTFGAETPREPEDESCDVAVEAGGFQQTLDIASRLPRVRGRLILAGYHQDGRRSIDLHAWNWRALDVVNAHERDEEVQLAGIRAAAAAVAEGRLDPSPLYTHVLPLERAGDAFDLLRTRPEGFVKALVSCRWP
jgi:threonine dehydrogenase-like Zn-dependent dehydrogenase